MKIVLFVIGGILMAFGLADFIGSFIEIDLWGDKIGVQLPELLWRYSGYIELLLGYSALKLATSLNKVQNS